MTLESDPTIKKSEGMSKRQFLRLFSGAIFFTLWRPEIANTTIGRPLKVTLNSMMNETPKIKDTPASNLITHMFEFKDGNSLLFTIEITIREIEISENNWLVQVLPFAVNFRKPSPKTQFNLPISFTCQQLIVTHIITSTDDGGSIAVELNELLTNNHGLRASDIHIVLKNPTIMRSD